MLALDRPPPFRKYISFIEAAAAKLYETGLRRCTEQNVRYGEKINPIDVIKRDSDFLSRHRFPRELVKRIALNFGASPFWEKCNDPELENCKNYVNAEWVVSIYLLKFKHVIYDVYRYSLAMLIITYSRFGFDYYSDMYRTTISCIWSPPRVVDGCTRSML